VHVHRRADDLHGTSGVEEVQVRDASLDPVVVSDGLG
jgi:hypothetical protein